MEMLAKANAGFCFIYYLKKLYLKVKIRKEKLIQEVGRTGLRKGQKQQPHDD